MRNKLDKFFSGVLKFVLPLTVLLIPLFFVPLTLDFFNVSKRYLLYILATIAILAWSLRNVVRRKIHLSLTPATFPLIILGFITLISAFIQAPIPYLSLIARTAIIISLIVIFLSTTTTQKNLWVVKATIYSLVFAISLASLISIYSLLGLNASFKDISWLSSNTFNPAGGPLPLLCLALPLLPALIYYVIKTRRWQIKAFLFLAFLVILGASLSLINFIFKQGPVTLALPASIGWSIALDIFKNFRTALIGTGPDSFIYDFTRLKPASINATDLWQTRFGISSNELFEVLTTTGLLGGLFWVLAPLSTLKAAFRGAKKYKVSPEFIFSFILLLGNLIGLLMLPGSIVSLTLFIASLALLAINLKIETKEVKDLSFSLSAAPTLSQGSEEVRDSEKPASQLLPIIILILIVPIFGFFWYFAGKSLASNLATKIAADTINTNATTSYNKQIEAYTLEPLNPSYRITFSQTSLAIAKAMSNKKDLNDQDKQNIQQLIQQAIREGKNATDIDPQSSIAWQNLSEIYASLIGSAQGASDWAIASYLKAIQLEPTNPALDLEIGGVFFSLKDYESAARFYETAISLKPDWANAHYNLAETLKQQKNYQQAASELQAILQLKDLQKEDYDKVKQELDDLVKLIPAAQKPAEQQPTTSLATPTPAPQIKSKPTIDLPTLSPTPAQ